jgi:hypothetical protein
MRGARIGLGVVRLPVVALPVVLAAVLGLSVPTVVTSSADIGPVRTGCDWVPELLPLPGDAVRGRVTAGAGEWFAGEAGGEEPGDPDQGVLWHDGRLTALGLAFGLDTALHAVNEDGVAVGTVTGADGLPHAVRYRHGRYEYLPSSGAASAALDVNGRGDVVGHDGGRLVVWPAAGGPRFLAVREGEAPYGSPAIDDDGTVVSRTGLLEGDTMRWHGYAWPPSGARTPVPADEISDVHRGQVVGGADAPDGATTATSWTLTGERRTHLGGATAVAVNESGLVAGADPAGHPLLWSGSVPTPLDPPTWHDAAHVTALNTHEAGGTAAAQDGTVPVRWRCH